MASSAIKSTAVRYIVNSNGEAWQFPDGMMICVKNVSVKNINFNIAFGSLYQNSDSWDGGSWAVEFLDKPYISANPVLSGGAMFLGNFNNTSKSAVGSCAIYRPTTAIVNVSIDIIAIGRWK